MIPFINSHSSLTFIFIKRTWMSESFGSSKFSALSIKYSIICHLSYIDYVYGHTENAIRPRQGNIQSCSRSAFHWMWENIRIQLVLEWTIEFVDTITLTYLTASNFYECPKWYGFCISTSTFAKQLGWLMREKSGGEMHARRNENKRKIITFLQLDFPLLRERKKYTACISYFFSLFSIHFILNYILFTYCFRRVFAAMRNHIHSSANRFV